MKQKEYGVAARAVLLCGLGAMLCGCSMLRASKRMDLAPFAENTINLLSEVKYGLDSHMMVYLREYSDDPAVAAYREGWLAFRPLLRGVAAYSIAIVTISRSDLTEKQRCGRLADMLEELLRPNAEGRGELAVISPAILDSALADIRVQTKYLDGLNAAQPLVDQINRFTNRHLDTMNDQLDAARVSLDRRIRAEHRASHDFYKVLVESQNFTFGDVVMLRSYRQGVDTGALAELLERDPQLKEIVPDASKATIADLAALEDRLLFRLTKINQLTLQVQPDLELQRAKLRELDELGRINADNLTRTRVTIIVWTRAHRGLAQGVTDPAKFDIMGAAKQALGAALPF